jgi:aminopeptidase N
MLAHVGEVRDPLLRAMVWGSLWDLVREARLAPAEYVELALRELPRERDEQIGTQILARGSAALTRYVSTADANQLIPRWEQLLLARAEDPKLSYGIRKSSLDALVGVARTPEALSVLRGYLDGTRRFDGKPVQQPTRWAIVRSLLALGDPAAPRLFAAEQARDTTPEAKREAFVAGAAVASAATKGGYFARYLDDPDLNEEWVTASLGAFHHPAHTALTAPHLRPSLDRLEWIRDAGWRRLSAASKVPRHSPWWISSLPTGLICRATCGSRCSRRGMTWSAR